MRINVFLKTSITKLFSRKSFSRFGLTKLTSPILLIYVFVINSIIQAYAQSARVAIVYDYAGGGNDFRIQRNANANSIPIEDAAERRIEEQGGLSVPNDGNSWASFRFESPNDYAGLIVKTVPRSLSSPPITRYIFPCKFSGQWIIAWRSSSNARTCDGEHGRIEIVTDPANLFSDSLQIIEMLTSLGKYVYSKQVAAEGVSSNNLLVNPGSEATVIKTGSTSTSSTTYETNYTYNVERCKPGSESYPEYYYCHRRDILSEDRNTVTKNTVEIEVLEGNVLIQSEQNPEGIRVREGQRYSYPDDDISDFDIENASFSCSTIRFLNPAYLERNSTSQNILAGIAEQLLEHRKTLGIVGNPPESLASLEKNVLNQLNSLRTNPANFLARLENNTNFYYDNWLRLPGEEISRETRIRQVDEAIDFLRSQQALPALSISSGMTIASQDHVEDQGTTGKNFGHTGDNGSGYWDRLRRYGSVGCELMGENISYFDSNIVEDGQSKAEMILVELLINDSRQVGSRENIFNPDFQVTGIACGSHGDFLREMCVINYAAGFLERTEAN